MTPTLTEEPQRAETKSAFARFLSIVLTVAILYLVFVVVLPSIASYEDIWHAITSMALPAALALVAIGLGLLVLTSMQLAAGLPGLRAWATISTQPMSVAIGAVVPGGTVPARAVFLRRHGVSTATYTRSYAAAAFVVTACVLLMPVVGLIVFLVVPQSADARDMRTLALVASVASLVVAAAFIAMVSSRSVCRWGARTAARLVGKSAWLTRKLAPQIWEEAVTVWREDTVQIVRRRRWRLTGTVSGVYWLNGALLIACMYACGLPYSAMGVLTGLATWSVARLLLSVPLTPGGVGVLELGYSAIFTAMVATQFDESVVAGVLLYRALTYVMPVFLGGVLIVITRLRQRREGSASPAAELV